MQDFAKTVSVTEAISLFSVALTWFAEKKLDISNVRFQFVPGKFHFFFSFRIDSIFWLSRYAYLNGIYCFFRVQKFPLFTHVFCVFF